MYKVKSRPWSEIATFYRSMISEHQHVWLGPMLDFVERIGRADYAGRVFGSTSLIQLRISYLPEFDPDREVLNVDFDRESGEFEFEYQETASPLYKRWKQRCSAAEAFQTFEKFLDRKHWFPISTS